MRSPTDFEITPEPFNVSEVLRTGRMTGRQFLMVAMLGLLILIDGMDTQVLALIARRIMGDLGLPISAFGIVFSTGLLGSVVGALVMSPIADRVLGPKGVVVVAMALAGLATLATPVVSTLPELLALRFVAGLGLGAVMPGIFSLASGYAPKSVFRPVTSSLIAFMPLGSFLGGMLGLAVVPTFGWQMLLYVGGALTLAITLVTSLLLPESIHFLLGVKKDEKGAQAAARRLFPAYTGARVVVDDLDQEAATKQPFARLFSRDLWRFTILVWVSGILSQGILYFVLSWTPALLEKSGSTSSLGMSAAAMFGIGGAVGTVAQGWLTKAFNIYRVMLTEMAIYVTAVLLLSVFIDHVILAPIMVLILSAAICAYQTGFVLILIEAYPSDIRSTGFGWSYGVGRIGATIAPALTGWLVSLHWTPKDIFIAAAGPGVISALALLAIRILLLQRERALKARSAA